MQASFQKIVPHQDSSLCCRRTTGESFNSRWHFHPEIELMYVERSHGVRLVGDSVQPFSPGDLVLVGPNLPHVWINNDVPARPPHDHAVGIFVQFREDFLGTALERAPELGAVAELLRRSRHGVHFMGSDVSAAIGHLQRLVRGLGTSRLAELVVLLDLLAHCPRQQLLCRAGYVPKLNHGEAERIERVCRFINEHLTTRLSLPSTAAVAGLSRARFSRFFRQKMRCTFTAYVTRLRIARAIHLMVEEEMQIAEACFASGFNNLSNFNRHFRAIKGMNPRAYLRLFRREKPLSAMNEKAWRAELHFHQRKKRKT